MMGAYWASVMPMFLSFIDNDSWPAVVHLAISSALIPIYWPAALYRFVLLLCTPVAHWLSPGERVKRLPEGDLPPLVVIVATRNEPAELVLSLLKSLDALNYPSLEIILADNTDVVKVDGRANVDFVEIYSFVESTEGRIRLIRRGIGEPAGDTLALPQRMRCLQAKGDTAGGKAGNLNCAIPSASERCRWALLLDADSSVNDQCIRDLVSVAVRAEGRGERVGFVQSTLASSNASASRLSRAQSVLDSLYYRGFFRLKAAVGVVSNWGHGVLVSRGAWSATEGFPRELSEDLAWANELLLQGGFENFLALAETEEQKPASWEALKIQRDRWARGTTTLLFKQMTRLWKAPHLRLWEKLDLTYDMTSYLFTALACLLPVLFLTSGVLGPARAQFFSTLLPIFYLVMLIDNLLVPLESLVRVARGKWAAWRLLLELPMISLFTGAIAAQVLIAVGGAIRGRRADFFVTPKGARRPDSFNTLLKLNKTGYCLALVNGWVAVLAWETNAAIVPLLILSPICYLLAPVAGMHRSYKPK
jgi:cellulose synthase/poly-beta-1,6-N-acetylglucosamine synthase-like glycosyltransferase